MIRKFLVFTEFYPDRFFEKFRMPISFWYPELFRAKSHIKNPLLMTLDRR